MRYAWLPLVVLLMGVNSCEFWEKQPSKQPSDNWVEHERLRAQIQELKDTVDRNRKQLADIKDAIDNAMDEIKRSCR